ncbi:MAG TPA: protease inhibitor I9 family protein, partial [Pyrinomonadaceae bacterium]|nr:protease inhibitor I9 family protein [Pyrinomonadaceae bacterium]
MHKLNYSLAGLLAIAVFASLMVVPASTSGRGETPVAFVPVQEQRNDTTEKFRRAERPVRNEYIVVLNDIAAGPKGDHSLVPTVASNLKAIFGGAVKRTYKHALSGFTIRMSEAAARLLSQDPRVAFVQEDSEVTLSTTQTGATWGIDRIDQRNLLLS